MTRSEDSLELRQNVFFKNLARAKMSQVPNNC